MRWALAPIVLLAGAASYGQVSPGPLARAHMRLEGNAQCTKCHASSKGAGMDARCLDCHDAVRTLRAAGRGLHARAGKDDCATCHPEHAGLEFHLVDWPADGPPGFDHATATGFELVGKHAAGRCRDCHQSKHRTGSFSASSWLGLEPSCRSCHVDPHAGTLGPDCARCHKPAAWSDVTAFDHAKTDFALTGKHEGLPCAKCHRPRGSERTILKPLPHAECSSCHKDLHDGRLGPNCAKCHATESFKKVPSSSFDHDKTRYPLRGAHRIAACAKCHDPGKPGSARPPFSTCGGCHADPHAGQATIAGARADCAACHDPAGFKVPEFTIARHASTPFPLEGKHAAVACAKCHHPAGIPVPKVGTAGVVMRPRHETCATCHADPHGGQFASRVDKGACESCHTTAGFAPSRYTPADHAKLRITLEGGHGRIPCAACHGIGRKSLPTLANTASAGPAKLIFLGVESECAGCHRDPHQFPDRSCTPCHGLESFLPSRVGPAEHGRFAFRLDGAHAAVPCVDCHKELKPAVRVSSLVGAPGRARNLPFRDARRLCADCHAGPHGTQFATRADGGRCDACHDIVSFKRASRFDHGRDAGFTLGRAHAAVPCERCHVTRRDAALGSIVVYRGLESRCQACHVPKSATPGGS